MLYTYTHDAHPKTDSGVSGSLRCLQPRAPGSLSQKNDATGEVRTKFEEPTKRETRLESGVYGRGQDFRLRSN